MPNMGHFSFQKYLQTRGPCPAYPGLEDALSTGNIEAQDTGELSDDAVQVMRVIIGFCIGFGIHKTCSPRKFSCENVC